MEKPAGIPLSQALSTLRSELRQAIDSASGEGLRFKIEDIEVELQVVATASGGASAGLNVWQVIQVGGHVDTAHTATHRIKLSLSPVLASGEDAHVAGPVSQRPR